MRIYLRAIEVSILLSFSLLFVCSASNEVVPVLTKCDLRVAQLLFGLLARLARNSAQVILPLYMALTNIRKIEEGR